MKHPGEERHPFVAELSLYSRSAVAVEEGCGGFATVNTVLAGFDGETADGDELGQYVVAFNTEDDADAFWDALMQTVESFQRRRPGAIVSIHDPAEYVGDDSPEVEEKSG